MRLPSFFAMGSDWHSVLYIKRIRKEIQDDIKVLFRIYKQYALSKRLSEHYITRRTKIQNIIRDENLILT